MSFRGVPVMFKRFDGVGAAAFASVPEQMQEIGDRADLRLRKPFQPAQVVTAPVRDREHDAIHEIAFCAGKQRSAMANGEAQKGAEILGK